MRIPIAIFALVLAGCAADPQSMIPSSNAKVPVHKLAESDGCTIYRFHDAGHYRYFVRCADSHETTVSSRVSCGKNCAYSEEILTLSHE